ncbi:MAG: T9SS type A sorting domain-containing protein [candidate division WOR-3 bacterium]|nr:T9SS type A sorting domain-containing protein [candidate division WOR-3 bacterium]
MTRVAAFLIMLVAIAVANPVMTVVFSEIQTAPDSLERIELHMYSGLHGYDLSGAQLITRAGTAVIDSGLAIGYDSTYVVIDRSNTTGVFSLGDDSDYVRLCIPGSYETLSVRYPANPFRAHDASWAPPFGASASILQWWEWQNGEWFDYYTWYVDETPTFGAANDDASGGICGYIRDDRGLPINGATVSISAAQGSVQMASRGVWFWPDGYFEQKPTGPGTFTVTAECPDHLPGAYPDPIVLTPNELREITITLDRVGMTEEAADKASCVGLHQHGQTLVVTADRPGTAFVTVYDNLGRVRMSEKVTLVSGSSEVPLSGLQSGVYFAEARKGPYRSRVKVILW